MNSTVYQLKDSLYLNITNRCMNQCTFCIRYISRIFKGEYPLWLEKEPSTDEVLKAIDDPAKYKEIVFCGYGEPLIRLATVIEVAHHLKKFNVSIRIDTNGQANLFYQRSVLPELKGLIDLVSISLNAEGGKVYQKICRPIYGERAFPTILDFVKESKKYIPRVEVTVVDLPVINISQCEKIAKDLGVNFRVRPYYEEKYVR